MKPLIVVAALLGMSALADRQAPGQFLWIDWRHWTESSGRGSLSRSMA
jgi:hypothetical protein